MIYNAEDISFTLDGVEFSGVSSLVFTSRERVPEIVPTPRAWRVTCSATFAMTDGWRALLDALLPPEPAGASHATLVRRLWYGGRKARSARRRLLARGAAIVMTTASGARVRGQAAIVSENTMIMRARFPRRGEQR